MANEKKFCARCGALLVPGKRFCGQCGGALPESPLNTQSSPRADWQAEREAARAASSVGSNAAKPVRRTGVLVLVIVLAIVLIGGGVAAYILWPRAVPPIASPTPPSPTAPSPTAPSPTSSPTIPIPSSSFSPSPSPSTSSPPSPSSTSPSPTNIPSPTPTKTPTPILFPTSNPTKTPSPTPATPRPSDTSPTPTASPSSTVSAEILLLEDFSKESSGWSIDTVGEATMAYRDGKYEIVVTPTNWMAWGRPDKNFSNFRADVEANLASGPDLAEYGFLLRYLDADNYYEFTVATDGTYRFGKTIDGQWETLVNWTDSDAIRQGRESNKITAICMGDLIALAVNGQPLREISDSSLTSGDLCLYAGTFAEGEASVLFDNVRVTSAPAPGKIISEIFSDPNSGWPEQDQADRKLFYADGLYQIQVLQKDWMAWATVKPPLQDFYAEVLARPLEVEGTAEYGLLFHTVDDTTFYEFRLSTTGEYSLARQMGGAWEILIDWTASTAIRSGLNENRLRLVCLGDSISLSVNGTFLEIIQDDALPEGKIGLFAGIIGAGQTTIGFDNLNVWELR